MMIENRGDASGMIQKIDEIKRTDISILILMKKSEIKEEKMMRENRGDISGMILKIEWKIKEIIGIGISDMIPKIEGIDISGGILKKK